MDWLEQMYPSKALQQSAVEPPIGGTTSYEVWCAIPVAVIALSLPLLHHPRDGSSVSLKGGRLTVCGTKTEEESWEREMSRIYTARPEPGKRGGIGKFRLGGVIIRARDVSHGGARVTSL